MGFARFWSAKGAYRPISVTEDFIVKELVRYYKSLHYEKSKMEYVHHIKNHPLAQKFAKEAGVDLRSYGNGCLRTE